MSPIISIVIPLYNKAPYIARTIHSILGQTFQDFEIIVVDDGSSDQGREVVQAIEEPRLHLICQSNQGPGAARNAGVRAAKADLIAFLDADDEWQPGYLEKGLELLRSNDGVAAVSQTQYFSPQNISRVDYWVKRGLREGVFRLQPETPPAVGTANFGYMSTCTTILKKSVIEKYGGFFDRYKCLYAEDAYLMLKIILNEKVYIHLYPNVIYHTDASYLTRTPYPRDVEPFLVDPSEIFEYCPNGYMPLLRRMLACRAFTTAMYYAFHGDRKISKDLLEKFRVPGFYTQEWAKASVFSLFAGVLPHARKLYRMTKRLYRDLGVIRSQSSLPSIKE